MKKRPYRAISVKDVDQLALTAKVAQQKVSDSNRDLMLSSSLFHLAGRGGEIAAHRLVGARIRGAGGDGPGTHRVYEQGTYGQAFTLAAIKLGQMAILLAQAFAGQWGLAWIATIPLAVAKLAKLAYWTIRVMHALGA
jgi:hypothetical protein